MKITQYKLNLNNEDFKPFYFFNLYSIHVFSTDGTSLPVFLVNSLAKYFIENTSFHSNKLKIARISMYYPYLYIVINKKNSQVAKLVNAISK